MAPSRAAAPGSVVNVTPPMPTPTPITSGITVVDNSRFLNGFMVKPLYRSPWDKASLLLGFS
jgi:hypothetical protein